MSQAAVVLGDKIVGTCTTHKVPNVDGNAIPAPPVPFSSALTVSLCPTVVIGGKPAAVVGSQGLNVPPHVGLHPADTCMAPPSQIGRITAGSATVLFGGKPAARTGSQCQMCHSLPGQVIGSATTVLIGG